MSNRTHTLADVIKLGLNDIANEDTVTESDMWNSEKGICVWKADRFVGSPHYYPVYRYKNYFSYSVLPLIALKGSLQVNKRYLSARHPTGFTFLGNETIDKEITRIGNAVRNTRKIKNPDELVSRIVTAIRSDIATIERANEGKTNILLIGGRDSMNMLLLSWSNPVIAVSGAPNYALVEAFIKENGLSTNLVLLDDHGTSQQRSRLVLENCLRNSLEHFRWTGSLIRLARQFEYKAVFWLGQTADAWLTDTWSHIAGRNNHPSVARVCRGLARHARALGWYPSVFTYILSRMFYDNFWKHVAIRQGTYMSILRRVTGCLPLSAYCGPEMRRVFEEVDLARTVTRDVRSDIGNELRGVAVRYPDTNPGPPLAKELMGQETRFLDLVSSLNTMTLTAPPHWSQVSILNPCLHPKQTMKHSYVGR